MSENKPRTRKPRRRGFVVGDILGYPLPQIQHDEADQEVPDYWHGANADVFNRIETMLACIHKSRPVKPEVDNLRLCLGSGNALFRADRYVLERLGMNHLDAMFFSLIPDLSRLMVCASYGDHPQIGRLQEAADYLASNFIGMQDEHFFLFCVNHRGRMSARVLLHKGIDDRALFSLEHIMTEVLRAEPAAFIVAHNHPRGTMRPSESDILCTEDLINAAAMLDIPLLDHIVVANGAVVSLRDNGFIPEPIWMAQNPDNHLLRDWLKDPVPKREKPAKQLTPEEAAAAAEKKRQALRRQRLHKIDSARRRYQRLCRDADRMLNIHRRLSTLVALDDQKHRDG